jgi:hypothetical protein
LNVAALNADKPLPSSAVMLNVYRAGDAQQQLLDEGQAGVPLGLALGHYDVKATFTASHDKATRWLRGVEIKDSQTVQPSVEFSSGSVTVSAELKNGQALGDFQVYIYYYPAGEHEQPITYLPAGETAVLSAGRYDVRANFFRSHDQPDIWLRNLLVQPGEGVNRTIVFPSGKLLVRAFEVLNSQRKELIGDNVVLHIHAVGERIRPIFSARSGEVLVLTAGEYDIRVEDTRRESASNWLENIAVHEGLLVEKDVVFNDEGQMRKARVSGNVPDHVTD